MLFASRNATLKIYWTPLATGACEETRLIARRNTEECVLDQNVFMRCPPSAITALVVQAQETNNRALKNRFQEQAEAERVWVSSSMSLRFVGNGVLWPRRPPPEAEVPRKLNWCRWCARSTTFIPRNCAPCCSTRSPSRRSLRRSLPSRTPTRTNS